MAQESHNIPVSTGKAGVTDLADDIVEQLKMAGRVQRNFLPARLPVVGTVRWATVFEPADWVSGDIYDVARLDEHNIGFYVADAVGHSMPAALLTMFLKHALTMRQTIGNEYKIFSPAEVITDLNSKMLEQELAGCLFATCCYCLLNIDTFEMTFARAGHPYPVLIRKGDSPQQLRSRGGLIGVFDDISFEQETVQLVSGDKIFVYSDGCESLVGTSPGRDEFVFTDSFCSITDLPIEQMMSEFNSFVNDYPVRPAQVDDVTAIGLEIL